MAVSEIFKPRRGAAATMSGSKSSIVLESGELFLETPGVGTAGHCKMMVGDGSSTYATLAADHKYALGETSYDVVEIAASTALNDAVSGNTLRTVLGALKQAISLNASAISTLNDDISNINTKMGNQVVYSLSGSVLSITTK